MILVLLGTQDKEFPRLLEAVDKEIKKGNIKDKVVVQAGQTKYTSDDMEIFDFLSEPELNKLIDKADLIITHGGVASILTSIKKGKKIIAAPRLAKYKEHHNDHQKQIINEFAKQGYLLELSDFNKLGSLINKSKTFKQKKFKSNTSNMINKLEKYIEDEDNISWYNKYRESLLYLFFGGCTTMINIVTFMFLIYFDVDMNVSNVISWILAVLFAYVTNKLYVFEKKSANKKSLINEFFSFISFRILSLIIDLLFMNITVYIFGFSKGLMKILSNIIVIVVNYYFSKLFIFKKENGDLDEKE